MPFDPSAYPSSEEEVAAVSGPPSHASVLQAAAQQQSQRNQRMDAYMQELRAQEQQALDETRAQRALINEARLRFAKASLYEQILQGRLFTDGDAVTLEVEAEFREFAQNKYCELLGIQQESSKSGPKLDDEQVEVLSELANRILQREVNSPAKPAPAAPKTAVMAPPRPPPPPAGSPVRVRRQVPRPPARLAQAEEAPSVAPQAPQQLPLPMQIQDQGARSQQRQVTLPSGMVVNAGPAQAVSTGATAPRPMPSPDEMVALAAYQGEQGLRQHQSKIVTETAAKPGA